jgi:DNA-binding NtrC family response regulator
VTGIISLEASCRAAVGEDFVWGTCNDELQLLADIATPYLGTLPRRPAPAPPTDALLPVIGASTASLVQFLRVFAQQEETILFAGATGVGKSRLARYCHEQSRRKGERFEALDLLAVPEELQMAELFGWKRGAFTGAVKDNAGAIGRAARGTLFIDEIDKLSLKAQGGLLQVLETRAYRAIGEDAGERRADVRFMVGTNADLLASVRAGRFREDLYYRIHVLPVRVPPLAERLDELPAWARFMLERRHREAGGEGEIHIVREALDLLGTTPWPGNLRQLDNIMRRAYVLALAERSPGSPLVIGRSHIKHSIGYEGGPVTDDTSSLLDLLWMSAKAFIAESERRGEKDAPLWLELSEAFRGLVIVAALHRSSSREDALRRLGLEHLLKNRNHHRMLRKEIVRVRELVSALGGQMGRELREALDNAQF